MTLETTQIIPLETWQDRSIRVKNNRLLLDMIVNAHKRGEIPEEIADSFSGVSVAKVYAIISYYLSHKTEIENYLATREAKAEVFWKNLEANSKYQARVNELKKLRKDKLKR